jgi:hypothetical protein
MPQIPYRANLSSSTFPITVAKAGRSVIIPGPDQNYDRRAGALGDDPGIPQAIYMENVLPTISGYQSVGYKTSGTQLVKGVDFDTIEAALTLRDGTILLFCTLGGVGRFFYRAYTSTVWALGVIVGAYVAPAIIDNIHIGYAQFTTYVYMKSGVNGKIFTFLGGVLTNVSGTITTLPVDGNTRIGSAYNYLIGYSPSRIYWSSTTTPTDFTASLVSGAGNEIPNSLWNSPTRILEHPAGAFIYTPNNVIAMIYSGNAKYPFKFREISNSGGYTNDSQIFSSGLNSLQQIGMDNSGKIQIISMEGAENVLPDLTEFFEKTAIIDSFNSTNNTFTAAKFTNAYTHRRVWLFMDRYICVSYGSVNQTTIHPASGFQYVLVFDTLLKRYGRLKVNHSSIQCNETGIFFIDYVTGVITQLFFDIYDIDIATYPHAGVLVLGKFQYVRDRFITLQELDIECPQDSTLLETQNFSVVVLPTLNGKNFEAAQIPTVNAARTSKDLKAYNSRITGQNLAIAIKGCFDISSLQMRLTMEGKR